MCCRPYKIFTVFGSRRNNIKSYMMKISKIFFIIEKYYTNYNSKLAISLITSFAPSKRQHREMKKILYLVCITATLLAKSQVGINTSTPAASLDVARTPNAAAPEGVLVTRITGNELQAKDNKYLANQNATLVYVTTIPTTPSTKVSNIKTPGFYYYDNDISKWVSIIKDTNFPKFFYMPSVLINTATLGAKTLDLYATYFAQYNNPPVKSAGSAGSIPTLLKTQLDYYVTYFDAALLSNVSIDANGLMSYTVIGNASDASFMNIVFVVK